MNRKLADDVILVTARALRASGQEYSVAAVRRELARRFGARGDTTRIYRLLRALDAPETLRASGDSGLAARCAELEREVAELRAQRDAARREAALAVEREERHQARWFAEIDDLRQKLRATYRAPLLIDGRDPHDLVRDLKARIAMLEREVGEWSKASPR